MGRLPSNECSLSLLGPFPQDEMAFRISLAATCRLQCSMISRFKSECKLRQGQDIVIWSVKIWQKYSAHSGVAFAAFFASCFAVSSPPSPCSNCQLWSFKVNNFAPRLSCENYPLRISELGLRTCDSCQKSLLLNGACLKDCDIWRPPAPTPMNRPRSPWAIPESLNRECAKNWRVHEPSNCGLLADRSPLLKQAFTQGLVRGAYQQTIDFWHPYHIDMRTCFSLTQQHCTWKEKQKKPKTIELSLCDETERPMLSAGLGSQVPFWSLVYFKCQFGCLNPGAAHFRVGFQNIVGFSFVCFFDREISDISRTSKVSRISSTCTFIPWQTPQIAIWSRVFLCNIPRLWNL